MKQGDTYESIMNSLDVPDKERQKILDTISKKKELKILRLNQKIFFKIDERNQSKIFRI